MKIRAYHSDDKAAVAGLLRLNTPAHFAAEEEPDFLLYLEKHATHYFVIEDKGEVIACGGHNAGEDAQTAKISWDIVHPAHQGKGLGRLLLRYRINELQKDEKIKTLIVRTSQTAFRFYEKEGFVLSDVKKDFWAPGFDLYYMQLKLSDN